MAAKVHCMTKSDPSKSIEWAALSHHREVIGGTTLSNLFAADPQRFANLSWSFNGLMFDFSKQRVTRETLGFLMDLARSRGVESYRNAMFAGDNVNSTENRAALHVALRDFSDRQYKPEGVDVAIEVANTRERIISFAKAIINGERTGYTGLSFDRVVNIGIGGSDLGSRCVVNALREDKGLHTDFVSTVDGTALKNVLAVADPARTIFIVCSKTFSTQETLANAGHARRWLVSELGEDAVASHFVIVSASPDAAAKFCIPEDRVFPIWSWVGGRYSLWSAIGLSIALGCGPDAFTQMLAGAHAMDRHFETAPLAKNIPIVAALIDLWNFNFWDFTSLAVMPYDHRLSRLPDYLQQLMMESNGKGITHDGFTPSTSVSPIIFGGPGSDGQHSFMQLIHQSPMVVPVEFIVALDGQNDPNRDKVIANVLAQSEALMRGLSSYEINQGSEENQAKCKTCPGNRPSTTILLDSVSAETVGALLAFYEHRTFVEGVLWGLNSFDQWGVELGKRFADELLSDIVAGHSCVERDSSTLGLMTAYRTKRKTSLT